MEVSAELRMRDFLKKARGVGCPVTVHLDSGKSLTGVVAEVGEQNTLLTRLADRDFFDALLRMENISAVEVQVRGL